MAPNEVSDFVHKVEDEAKTLIKGAVSALEAEAEAAWQAVKPDVIALGETVASQVGQAAATWLESGGSITQAIDVVLAQLPADLAHLEHAVAAFFSAKVAQLQAAAG